MKITDIKTFVVDCFRTNWVFVKVYTDEGIDGVGEGSRKRVELKCLTTIIFSVFRRVKSRKVVLDIDSPRQNPQKN